MQIQQPFQDVLGNESDVVFIHPYVEHQLCESPLHEVLDYPEVVLEVEALYAVYQVGMLHHGHHYDLIANVSFRLIVFRSHFLDCILLS